MKVFNSFNDVFVNNSNKAVSIFNWNSYEFKNEFVSGLADELEGDFDVADYMDEDELRSDIKSAIEYKLSEYIDDFVDVYCTNDSACLDVLDYMGDSTVLREEAMSALTNYLNDNDYSSDVVEELLGRVIPDDYEFGGDDY